MPRSKYTPYVNAILERLNARGFDFSLHTSFTGSCLCSKGGSVDESVLMSMPELHFFLTGFEKGVVAEHDRIEASYQSRVQELQKLSGGFIE